MLTFSKAILEKLTPFIFPRWSLNCVCGGKSTIIVKRDSCSGLTANVIYDDHRKKEEYPKSSQVLTEKLCRRVQQCCSCATALLTLENLKPPGSDKYTTSKNRFIELHSESEASKIRTLLQGLELGDKRPSQLLTRMGILAGDIVGEPLLKSLWLRGLPNSTQTFLAGFSEDLAGLASVLDKISDFPNHSDINAVHVTPLTSDARVTQLEQQVAQLTTLVGEITSTIC
ncbi:hypothetical protein AVEN_198455-1 [Araneus ventricosus]|uniref:Uncharacterized protein n=1 Tax=Araneus ventricosus TaxID=182803 RepID=A0A4Y2ERX2_ARAVE|nr:hypothetical protein AVEN_198455-1 [Araneus ventricosus]